jgi:hypothetical protein
VDVSFSAARPIGNRRPQTNIRQDMEMMGQMTVLGPFWFHHKWLWWIRPPSCKVL